MCLFFNFSQPIHLFTNALLAELELPAESDGDLVTGDGSGDTYGSVFEGLL
jgi:hypothetical protein